MKTNEFDGPPRTWPPLGMPTGSVRALLTLIVVSVVITKMVRGDEFSADSGHDSELLWVETLLIALSHYFTSRRFVELPPEARRQLEDEGVIDREQNPLFLPRNSIRFLIVGSFGLLAYYLQQQGRLFQQHTSSLLAMMGAFLLGAAVRKVGRWWNRNRVPPTGTWGDIKAVAVLVMLLVVAIPEYLGSPDILHPTFHRVALGMMLFYFGSR